MQAKRGKEKRRGEAKMKRGWRGREREKRIRERERKKEKACEQGREERREESIRGERRKTVAVFSSPSETKTRTHRMPHIVALLLSNR